MNFSRALLAALGTACLLTTGGAMAAEPHAFPNKALRIVVPFTAGSGSDSDSRFYGDLLGKKLGQPVVVENRPGASGLIAVQSVKSAPADGYSILLASNSPMSVNPAVMKNLPYDPFKDFKPLVGSAVGPAAFVVAANSPYKTMQDVVAAAKREKRPVAVGNYSAGYQLVAAWLGTASGAQINHISYKGGSQMVTDVIGGQLEVAIVDPSAFVEMHRDGRLRMLAVTGAKRMEAVREVPTMIESGFADFETYVWSSFFVRSETPDDITRKLIMTLSEAMAQPEAEVYRKQRGGEQLDLKGDEMRKFQLREYERFKRVAETAGLVQ